MIEELIVKWNSYKIVLSVNEHEKGGIPVIFLHGLGSAGTDFKDVINSDTFKNRTVVIPDLMGYGRSDKPFDFSYDLKEQAMTINSVLEAIHCEKADFVAHSMGGVIAILFAKQFPEKINKLIVAEPNLIPDNAKISKSIEDFGSEEEFKYNFVKFIERFNKKESPSALRFYNTLTQTTYYSLYRSAVSILKHTINPFYSEFLELEVQKYFLRGEKSYQTIDEKILNDFREKNIPMYEISKAGHGMMGDNPEEFYDIVRNILNS